jgi:hypothetical protein
MGEQVVGWSEDVLEYAPFCLRRSRSDPEQGLLLEVLDDYWDAEGQAQIVKMRVVKTGALVERPLDWLRLNCETLNEMEVIAWAAS